MSIQRLNGARFDIEKLQQLGSGCDDSEYNPFDVVGLQLYNPVYGKLFGDAATDTTFLDHSCDAVDADQVCVVATNRLEPRNIHFKFSPLLDPFAYMTGKYSSTEVAKLTDLPTTKTSEEAAAAGGRVLPKIAHFCNAAYVDAFFNYLTNLLLEKHGFLHGIAFYGSYLGVQRKFKVDVSDDVEHLRNSRFFHENLGKLFTVPGWSPYEDADALNSIGGSRRNKRKIDVIEDADLDNVIEIVDLSDDLCQTAQPSDLCQSPSDLCQTAQSPSDLCNIYCKEDASANVSVSDRESSDSELNYSDDEDEEDEDDQDDEEDVDQDDEEDDDQEDLEDLDDEEDQDDLEEDQDDLEEDQDDLEEDEEDGSNVAFIKDFPCQMICMEKCDGTLDDLFDRGKMDAKQATSALMQVIFTLLAYQKAFQFTHNDLHTNNIMYVNTDLEYLYYQYEQRTYKVPTHGRIYKIIDFGRSIYTFEKHVFCSDSFFAKGDAATQYNFGPCLDAGKPVLEPNPSFDLCRLGVSIFDFVMDIDTDIAELDAFQKTIRRWCQDDRKHNVLYKRNGDDRYPNFKLYKMIARTVHRHTPQAQLNYFIFRKHVVEEVPEEVRVMNLDDLPTY